ARQKRAFSFSRGSSSSRAVTVFPGAVPRTKTTRPSWRATKVPPAAGGPTVTVRSRPPRAGLLDARSASWVIGSVSSPPRPRETTDRGSSFCRWLPASAVVHGILSDPSSHPSDAPRAHDAPEHHRRVAPHGTG